jgi:hypothetical protein
MPLGDLAIRFSVKDIQELTYLTSLSINCYFGEETSLGQTIGGLTNLTKLRVFGCNYTLLDGLQNLTKLSTLHIKFTRNFKDEHLKRLTNLTKYLLL